MHALALNCVKKFSLSLPFASNTIIAAPTFKKCNRNQNDLNECLSKAVKDAIEQLNRPFRDVGLPSMEPLEIPELTVGAGTGAVGLVQHFKNMKVHGFTKPETTKFE